MKKILLTAAIALTGLVGLSTSHAQFTPNYTNAALGDLILGFETTGGGGSKDLLIDLGSVTNIAALDSLNLNLNSDLTSEFGTNYANTVSYGLYSVNTAKDIWASAAATNSQGYPLVSFAAASTQKTDFQNFTANFNTDGVNGQTTTNGVFENTSETYSWTFFTPFSGAFNNANYANIEVPIGTTAALFEQIPGSSSLNGTNYGVSLDVSASGQLTAVPEPSSYALLGLGFFALTLAYRRRLKA